MYYVINNSLAFGLVVECETELKGEQISDFNIHQVDTNVTTAES